MKSVLGIIGGSGIYELPGLAGPEWRRIESPWGEPSDAILHAELDGLPVRFLPRHGRGHVFSPTDIDYRANIDAMKRAGVTDLVSVSACGSLREDLSPGMFVLVEQFVDRTFAREKSFFGKGCVAHVSMAHPVSPRLVERIAAAAEAEDVRYRWGGTYVTIEGPHFSSRAESELYRSWGCDVIGMTNMPEAKLAREAEMSYATIAMVTDYDCWHPEHGNVDVKDILRVLDENRDKAQRLLVRVARDFPREREPCPVGSDSALEHAIMTAPARRDPALLARLDAVAGRVLRRAG
ncbi:S-methyl-5'-thioadenosine phosphorylase [Rhizobiales bacterium L72]|uniref:S-methyl-5'-thioadenosine phosphorylase n=2 Tax=Propylenella binzhouense TaxID=2555902 RepID=A0A964T2I2_9HYPH|nr:S-methyl-5'-thioadenosine phosphorylase [Propylenella binzhouense]MYZ46742.1 S-methyl-5'-thioadenosine phosphorylase [Propylenella binzhouense]